MSNYNNLNVKVQLIKETCVMNYPKLRGAEDAFELVKELANKDREHFLIACLNTKNQVIGISTIAVGTLNSALIHPREVFKAAILANSHSIILFHNHPSGNLDISKEDIAVTNKLKEAGNILEIPVLDHLIVAGKGYISFSSKALL